MPAATFVASIAVGGAAVEAEGEVEALAFLVWQGNNAINSADAAEPEHFSQDMVQPLADPPRGVGTAEVNGELRIPLVRSPFPEAVCVGIGDKLPVFRANQVRVLSGNRFDAPGKFLLGWELVFKRDRGVNVLCINPQQRGAVRRGGKTYVHW